MKDICKRNLVFISHATPEDNDFTLWLSTRLKLLGYEVWSDVTQLFGGEKWWDDIEEAVHNSTIKFVIVITKTSLTKPGVQREVELALDAESKHKLPNFIIPIIIDDSEFGGQPYGMSERNIIPFSRGWGFGLERLIERLERDNTPKELHDYDLGAVLAAIREPSTIVEFAEDIATSNLLAIEHVPQELNFYRLPGDVKLWRKQLATCPYGWFEWAGMLATFAGIEDLSKFLPKHVILTKSPVLKLEDVIAKSQRNHSSFLRNEVFKKVNFLISEAWNQTLNEKGLHKYELANGRLSWFFPAIDKYKGRVEFADQYGTVRRKVVQGFSAKNKVYWHYAIEIKVQFGVMPKVCLIPHVVFTEDGLNPISDSAKMHRLRRGFCKSWWNDRWRDLLLLYLYLLSEGGTEITLDVGNNRFIRLSSRPQFMTMAYKLTTQEIGEQQEDEEGDVEVNLMEFGDDYDE